MRASVCLLVLFLCGCASNGPTYEAAANSKLIESSYAGADAVLAQARGTLDRDQPILAATLVNIDELTQSSSLGRLISEHLASRLAQQGMSVIETKLRGTIFMQRTEGEMLLSRDVREIASSHNAQAVVVGTYAISRDYIYVTVKLVRSTDSHILGAHNYVLPADSNVKGLLAGGR
jgi:TolB-like protein